MAAMETHSNIAPFPSYPHLDKIILVHLSLSYLLFFSITTAVGQPDVPLNSRSLLLQRMKLSPGNGFLNNGNRGAESILDKVFKAVVHANRVKRDSDKSSGKSPDESFDDKGANPQKIQLANLNNGPDRDELKRRHLYLTLAQEDAKCLQEFGELEPVVSFEFPQDLYRPFVCLAGSQNFSACEQCIQTVRGVRVGDTVVPQVKKPDDATSGPERYSNLTLTTSIFCESTTQHSAKVYTTKKSMSTKSLQNQTKETNNRHFVYLKSLFNGGGDGTVAKINLPVVFVIEKRKLTNANGGKWTGWKVLGKSPYGFDKIQVAYLQQTYQWRVTAVGIHGPLAVSTVKSFETLDGYREPGPPTRVYVIENKPKESTVDVLLGWDPPQERACFYKIVLETRNDEEPARTMRIKGEPLGVHKLWFRELKFDSTYEVRITSRSAEWHEDESTHASLSFTTPACLDAHQFRFDRCAPPAPRNLSFSVKAAGSFNVMDVKGKPTASLKKHFTAQLAWKPPAYANGTNTVEKYIVDIGAFSINVRGIRNKNSKHQETTSELIDPQYLLAPRKLDLPGNVTHLLLDNLDGSAEYTILVSAVSSKGSSPAATLTIKLESDVGSLKKTVSLWVYPWGVLLTVLVIASTCRAVKRISQRREIKAARDSYFKSIDQRDAFTVEWSMASLTEDPCSSLTGVEESSFHNSKWHVRFQDLTIGDIIGKGEFGVVREAEIKRDKFLELLKRRHSSKTLDTKYRVSKTKVSDNETGTETVALKMLRVAATNADREDLNRELVTMQGLGVHPQIVTLLGVCTTPKSMHLVLEYCPGGNLLSFLRKFRENYLPMLNLTCGKKTGNWFENPAYKRHSPKEKFRILSSNVTEGLRQQICYTDLHHNEMGSSSQELSEEIQECSNEVTETETPACISNETAECESITEKDVLSYARQIAVGMAYLERNHVIHRDLACRNILVMEDHKRVKISDFGLSRDIYTRNFYRQRTEGKVPFKWMALESITSRIFTSKSDVWSYGIVLWELVTLGALPYPAVENQELLKLLRTGYRMERPDNCSEELYALMRKCWRTVQVDRPNFTELSSYLEAMLETEPELYLTLQP